MIPYDLNDAHQVTLLNHRIKKLALKQLETILLTNSDEIEIKFDQLKSEETFSLILRGKYTCPAFKIDLHLYDETGYINIGRYTYITTLNFEFIDETYVLY